jgi:RNA 2',3'-cyclic 3'-phosphodiesterase
VIRTFIAVELPRPLQQALLQVQQQLEEGLPRRTIRWTAPENLHLTLRFLDDTSQEQREQLAAGLAEIAHRQVSFELVLQGLGVFPNYNRLRIVWVGLSGGLAPLQEMADQVERLARQASFAAEEKPFSPHITLGRAARDVAPASLRQAGRILEEMARQPELGQEWGRFAVEEIVHMQSELHSGGSLYTPLQKFHFAGGV